MRWFPPVPQKPQVPIEKVSMSNFEMRVAIHNLTHVFSTQVGRDATVQLNLNSSTTSSRIRDFTRMNPSTFFVSKIEDDLQGLIDEVFKVVDAMGMISQEKAQLAAYQLKDVAQVWYEQWKDDRPVREGRITKGILKWLSLISSFSWN